MRNPSLALLLATLALLVTGAAQAAPITMTPGSVSIDTILGAGNGFTLTFDGGDTSDNVLDFTVHGGGGTGFMNLMPSTALAALVFDGTSIIDAGDTVVVLGKYSGKYKATGKSFEANFAHVWKMQDGKATQFIQYVDTLLVHRALQR